MNLRHVGLIVGIWCALIVPAMGWQDDVEEFVASLNSPQVRQETGLREARHPEEIVNRLEVVFQEDVPREQRARVMRTIGSKFLTVLFERRRIPTVTIIERDASGAILDRAVVNFGVPILMLEDLPTPQSC